MAVLLNRLSRDGVVLFGIDKPSPRHIVFCCLYKDRAKVIAILRQLCYNYTLIGSIGIIPALQFIWSRIGLIAGMVCFAAAIILSNFYLADIKVYGCESDSERAEIISTLQDLGISVNTIGRLAPESIERSIYAAHKNTAFVQAKYSGLVLYISLVKTQPPPVMADTQPRDIVSGYEGKITKFIAYQGTPLVKVGDTVKKGQVLIAGYRQAPDGGQQIPVRAMGIVCGNAQVLYTEIFDPNRTELVRTGEIFEQSYINAFGAIFPIKNKEVPFTSFDMEERQAYLAKNTIITWTMVTRTYYRTELQKVYEDFDKSKKYLVEEAERKATEKAEKLGKVTGLSTEIKDQSDIKHINVTVVIEKSFIYGE